MPEQEIEVETTVTVEEPETSSDESSAAVDGAATDHVIDAAVNSGVAAERATDAAGDATVAAIDADLARSGAEQAADSAAQSASVAERTLAALEKLTEQNALLLAARQAEQSSELAAELPDAEELNPSVDIAPESGHWLTRRWGAGLFGRKRGDQ